METPLIELRGASISRLFKFPRLFGKTPLFIKALFPQERERERPSNIGVVQIVAALYGDVGHSLC